jgi:hypothetical protein
VAVASIKYRGLQAWVLRVVVGVGAVVCVLVLAL